jgi:arylsulfatase A-like enzyme
MPLLKNDDWEDLPAGAAKLMKSKKWFWKGMESLESKQPGSYRRFVKAYAACCTFSDASVGRLMKALDQSGQADNTIIVLWSDHGFHLGEKEHIEKFALWEKANHVPLIIVDPRKPKSAGKVCPSPVDLTCLYPTLLELCGLPVNPANDGISVASQVSDPSRKIAKPALMTYGFNNHAVRTDRWRYIRYADGTEELYDHERDPNEWNNLADQAEFRSVIGRHAEWIPKKNAKPFGNLR